MPEEPEESGASDIEVEAKSKPAKSAKSADATTTKAKPASSAVEDDDAGPLFTPYGLASAALAAVCVAAVVLVSLMWTNHRQFNADLNYQSRALQAAADWTSTLINMNKDNVEANLQTLRDGTIGQLNADFDASIEPYKEVVQRLQANTQGQVESVAIESVRHDPAAAPGAPPVVPEQQPELAAYAKRTDTVLVVATSVSQNVSGAAPQTVRWNLRVDVSDVDGRLLISRLERIR